MAALLLKFVSLQVVPLQVGPRFFVTIRMVGCGPCTGCNASLAAKV